MINTKRISALVVVFYIIALIFFLYGLYMIYYSITDIISYHTYDAVSTSSIIQYVVSSCALYLGLGIVIFAAAKILKAFSTFNIAEKTDVAETMDKEESVQEPAAEPQTNPEPKAEPDPEPAPAPETTSESTTAQANESASESPMVERVKLSADKINDIVNKSDNTKKAEAQINNNDNI